MVSRVNSGQGSSFRKDVLQNIPHHLLITILVITLLDFGCAVRMMGVSSAAGADDVESVDRVKYVVEGDNVTLDCNFDLEGEQLYTLLWWKDEQMLLRYLPGEFSSRGEKASKAEGVQEEVKVEEDVWSLVDERDSEEEGGGGGGGGATEEKPEVTSHYNATSPEAEAPVKVVTWFDQAGIKAFVQEDPIPRRLLLTEVYLNASGDYVCEVTTEAPTYYTVRSTTTLRVMVPPRTNPMLEGAKGVVGEGAIVQATCTSSPSFPTPTVTFWINDKRVMEEYMTPPLLSMTEGGEIEVQRSVEFLAHRGVFIEGALLLQCRVTLHGLVWNATSKLFLDNYDGTSSGVTQVNLGSMPSFTSFLVALLVFAAFRP